MDDRFYGIDGDGHLARFRKMMDELTLDDVNAAIKRHLQYDNLKIAIVTGRSRGAARRARERRADADRLRQCRSPPAVLAEDREIAAFPLDIAAERVTIVPVETAFER